MFLHLRCRLKPECRFWCRLLLQQSLFPYHIAYQHIPHSLASVAQLQQGFHKGDHNQAFLFPERQI